jgi:hypothetical protein
VSGPSCCCSPRRRLPGAASSRYREVGRRRRGRPGQQARHGVGRRCPAGGVHPSGLGVRDPAVRPSGVRSPGAVVHRVRRSAVCCPPIQRPAVRCPAVRCPAVRPDASVTFPLRRWRRGPGRAGRATLTTGTGGGPGGCRAVDGSIDGPGGRDADADDVAVVGGRWLADPGRRLGAGRGGRACPLSDQAGQADVRSARRGGCAVGTGAGCSARWLHRPRGCRPRAGGLTTLGGRRRV